MMKLIRAGLDANWERRIPSQLTPGASGRTMTPEGATSLSPRAAGMMKEQLMMMTPMTTLITALRVEAARWGSPVEVVHKYPAQAERGTDKEAHHYPEAPGSISSHQGHGGACGNPTIQESKSAR